MGFINRANDRDDPHVIIVYKKDNKIKYSDPHGGRLLSSNKVMLGGLESHVDMLTSLNNLILLGCGTSFHADLLGSHFFAYSTHNTSMVKCTQKYLIVLEVNIQSLTR